MLGFICEIFKTTKKLISFFRVSTFYKYIFLFLLFVGLRLPVLLLDVPWLLPEWKWILVGERMSRGFILYAEIWDNTAPLSALVYQGLYGLFGANQLAYQLLSTLLIFIQAVMFSEILKGRYIYSDLTLVPALLYLVLMSVFPDFYILSPALLANTFLLIVLRYAFLHIAERRRYNSVFEIGAYLGIATLFYFPSIALLFAVSLSFLSFTSTKLRDYLLMFFSFIFPIFIAFLVFFMSNSEYDFYLSYIQSVFYLRPIFYISPFGLLLIFAPALILSLWHLFRTSQHSRFTNYQSSCQTIVVFWLVFSVLSIFLDSEVSVYSLIPAVPALVFLMTHLFLMLKNTLLKEILFLGVLVVSMYFCYSTVFKTYLQVPIPWQGWQLYSFKIPTDRLLAAKHPMSEQFKGKKILVLGGNVGYYLQAKVASPYLNWRLSQRHFEKMNQYYDIKTQVYRNIFQNSHQDTPEYIIDVNGTAEKFFKELPLGEVKYQKIEGKKNIYQRRQD